MVMQVRSYNRRREFDLYGAELYGGSSGSNDVK